MEIHVWIPVYRYPYMDARAWIAGQTSMHGYPFMDRYQSMDIHLWIPKYGYHSGVVGKVKKTTVKCVVACSGTFDYKVAYKPAVALKFDRGPKGIVGCGKLP